MPSPIPEKAFADAPTCDPVFYYYHTDHLGSSMIMTDRDGSMVRHYGYTAFGSRQYKHNANTFDVTNRYTGRQFDDDTKMLVSTVEYKYDPAGNRVEKLVDGVSTKYLIDAYNHTGYAQVF